MIEQVDTVTKPIVEAPVVEAPVAEIAKKEDDDLVYRRGGVHLVLVYPATQTCIHRRR